VVRTPCERAVVHTPLEDEGEHVITVAEVTIRA
jgi:hypothetical protein